MVEPSRVVEATRSLLPKKSVSSDPIQRSKRMLEAAGCYGLTSDDPGIERGRNNLQLYVYVNAAVFLQNHLRNRCFLDWNYPNHHPH